MVTGRLLEKCPPFRIKKVGLCQAVFSTSLYIFLPPVCNPFRHLSLIRFLRSAKLSVSVSSNRIFFILYKTLYLSHFYSFDKSNFEKNQRWFFHFQRYIPGLPDSVWKGFIRYRVELSFPAHHNTNALFLYAHGQRQWYASVQPL